MTTKPITTDPLTITQEAANVGTDVSVGPGETVPEAEGKRRPGMLGDDPLRAPVPGMNPGSNPDNPGDDPGVQSPQQPDVLATDPSVPPTASGAPDGKAGADGRAANDED
jgi:hypothetical protein